MFWILFFLVVLYCIAHYRIFFFEKHIVLHDFKFISAMFNTLIPEKTGSCMEVRLDTPCSKFEITNMVDDQVNLTPEGICGASCVL